MNAADTGPADAVSDGLINIVGVDPVCTLPAEAGTGACVTLGGNIACNPVTSSPCNGDAGEACDIAPDGGFQCFAPPPPNSGTLCGTCDDQTTACAPSTTCVTVDGGGGECARYCCTDGECGTGHCDTTALDVAPVGICVK